MRAGASSASTTRTARPLVSALGELRPSRADRDRRRLAGAATSRDARPAPPACATSRRPSCCRNDGDAVKRLPYFCAGCPHNTRPRCPKARARRPASAATSWRSWMDRDTDGLIQMGGEGVDWVSHAMFTKVPHVFQNLGDGTYYHSGYLAIRQAIAAKANAHLQDPLQRRGRDDRRPAGRRHHHASTRSRARSRPKARSRSSSSATTSRKYDAHQGPASRPAPSSTTAPSSTPCSAACARCRA